MYSKRSTMTNNYIDLTAVPFDNEAEEKFKKYKSQIDNLRNNRLITDEVALVTLSIIRTKLGLPSIVIYPVQQYVDKITL